MAQQSNIPSDKRRPGTFLTLDFESGPVGLVTVGRAIALIGAKTAAGTGTVAEPALVGSDAECDAIAGQGSILALMGKKVFETFKKLGGSAQVYLVPVADPAGTAALFTFTCTGTTTEAGDLVIKIAGRTIRVPLALGVTDANCAIAIEEAIDARIADLPGTAGSATTVCTFTTAVTGVNGNGISVETISAPAGMAVVAAASATVGAGAIDVTAALDSLGTREYQSIAISNTLAADVTDLAAHLTEMWAAGKKRFRHAFMGNRDTLATATTVASGADTHEIVVASYEGSGSMPGEIAASVAAMRLTKDKPSQNYDGTELPLFAPSDTLAYTDTEVETALAGGVTPLTKLDNGFAKMERLVTTQTTDSAGNPFENLRDFTNSWVPAYYAKQVDFALARAIGGRNLDSKLLRSLRSIAYRILLLGQENNDIHNVEARAGEIQVSPHPSIPTRALTDVPISPVPNAHQVDTTVRVIVEGAQ
jgi:phage tail sheath gpL-like